jgi:hypothetical protein
LPLDEDGADECQVGHRLAELFALGSLAAGPHHLTEPTDTAYYICFCPVGSPPEELMRIADPGA